MTQLITDIGGNSRSFECLSCAIADYQVEVRGGSVIRSEFFDVHQDFEIPIRGFMILTSLRHIKSVSEFTEPESGDFMHVLRTARNLQRDVLGIRTVYLHQEEETNHHFHLWMFPRHNWMSEFGYESESMRPIMEYARANLKTQDNLDELDRDVRLLRQAADKLAINVQ